MSIRPQIGDRITARHVLQTPHCDMLHNAEVQGYVKDVGTYAIYVVDTDADVVIHLQNGWQIRIHPEITNERS